MHPARFADFDWNNLLTDDNKIAMTYPPARDAYVELDLGADREIDQIYIANRGDCCQHFIASTSVIIYNAGRVAQWTLDIVTNRDKYLLPVSPETNNRNDADVLA